MCLLLLNMSDFFGGRIVILLNCVTIVSCFFLSAIVDDYEVKMLLVGVGFGCESDFIPLFLFMMNEVTGRLTMTISQRRQAAVDDFSCSEYRLQHRFHP